MVLPAGLRAVGVAGAVPFANTQTVVPGCKVLAGGGEVLCEFEGGLPAFDGIEVRVKVDVESVVSGKVGLVVSGGEVSGAEVQRGVRVGSEEPAFGVEEFGLALEEAGGGPVSQAGAHPFQMTASVAVNSGPDPGSLAEKPGQQPVVLPKDIVTGLPAGLVGDPNGVPTCSLADFLRIVNNVDLCTAATQVGVVSTTANVKSAIGSATFVLPLFNLERGPGEPARFGFMIPEDKLPVVLDPQLRDEKGGDYGIDVHASDLSQTGGVTSARVTVWGAPGDPRHDAERGWSCIYVLNGTPPPSPCEIPEGESNTAFLRLPTQCETLPEFTLRADSWDKPGEFLSFTPDEPLPLFTGCNRLQFAPSVSVLPSTSTAGAASGLDVTVEDHNEGLTAGEGRSQSDVKDTTITLPEGMTVNPSAGNGLGACSQEQFEDETLERQECPADSQIGELEVETPLLNKVLHGAVYVAEPYGNQFHSLLAMFFVVKDPETGVLVRIPGEVQANETTGQLTSTIKDLPQLPFSRVSVHLREGPLAPLITPPGCTSEAQTTGALIPWANPQSSTPVSTSFQINNCPGSPFTPGLTAGTESNSAGSFSPLVLRLTRSDRENEISTITTSLPGGLSADLNGVQFCSQAQIENARAVSGLQEKNMPSCPAGSQLGETLVGSGVGASLTYVPGKIYFAGPYRGAPFSLVSITPAVVGPFDLGDVVLRFALQINPETSAATVEPTPGEPLPRIIKGIVTHARDIRVMITRAGFTLNPTNCNPTQITTTITSTQNQTSTPTARYQAANCPGLKFATKLTASTQGQTSRANGASLTVHVSQPSLPLGTFTNLKSVKTEIPRSLPARLETLKKSCPAPTFNTNPAGCPSTAIVGHVTANSPLVPEPLQGPAYLVSHAGEELPNVIFVLQGYGITIHATSTTHIHNGITTSTFNTLPDQPLTNLTATFPEQRYSLLGTIYNLCTLPKTQLTMPTTLTAQNGTQTHQNTTITPTNCPKHHTKTKHKH